MQDIMAQKCPRMHSLVRHPRRYAPWIAYSGVGTRALLSHNFLHDLYYYIHKGAQLQALLRMSCLPLKILTILVMLSHPSQQYV